MVGPPYEAAVRLSATATSNWQSIDGDYSGKGVDILTLPFSRFLSVIYVWAIEHMSAEDGEKWKAMLTAPIPGHERRTDGLNEIDQLNNL